MSSSSSCSEDDITVAAEWKLGREEVTFLETPEVRGAALFDTCRAGFEVAVDCTGGFTGRGGLNAGPLRRTGLEEDTGGILLVGNY